MSTVADPETAAANTKFHLSLNVNELARSVRFLTALLGVEPAKRRPDYAKFELSDPPLVLSLEPHGFAAGGALNHLGFRMANAAALVAAQARLEAAGIATQREEGVECCYARQTKFWVHDPDGSLWEIYVFEGDLEHRGAGQALEVIQRSSGGHSIEPSTAARTVLHHRLGQPFPEQLALSDGIPCPSQTADEVLLQGTFNARLDAGQRGAVLTEVRRVLRPGGQVLVHVLTAAKPLPNTAALRLPGPAAAVEQVPLDRELVAELEAAGFTGIHYAKFGASPCFHFEGVELRETKLLAYQPGKLGGSVGHTVIYKGPFRELRDDVGRLYRRGERVMVDAETHELLKSGAAAEQFLFLG